MSSRRRVATLLGVLVLLATLGACGSSPKPKALPSPSASGTGSPSTDAAQPPAIPALTHQKSRAGAEAAVKYFVAALSFSGPAGDTTTLRQGFTSHCTRCESLAVLIDETAAHHGAFYGGRWHLKRLSFHGIQSNVAFVDATVDYDAQTWIKSAGAKPVTYRATKNHLHAFQLEWSSAKGWLVGALDPSQ